MWEVAFGKVLSLIKYYTERRFFSIHFEPSVSAFTCIFCFSCICEMLLVLLSLSMCYLSVCFSLYVLSVSLSYLMFLSFSYFLPLFISLLFYIFITALQYITRLTRHIFTASHADICVNFSLLFSFSISLSFSSLSLYHSFSEYLPPITCHVFSANRREHRRLRSFLMKVSKLINSLI